MSWWVIVLAVVVIFVVLYFAGRLISWEGRMGFGLFRGARWAEYRDDSKEPDDRS